MTELRMAGLSGSFKAKAASAPVSTPAAPAEAVSKTLIQDSDNVLVFLGVVTTFAILGTIGYFLAYPCEFKKLKAKFDQKESNQQQGFSGPRYGVLFDRNEDLGIHSSGNNR